MEYSYTLYSRTSPVSNASGCQSGGPGSKPPRAVCESVIMGIQIGTFGKRQIPKTQPRDVYLKNTEAQEFTVAAPGHIPLTILEISQTKRKSKRLPKTPCFSSGYCFYRARGLKRIFNSHGAFSSLFRNGNFESAAVC